MMIYMPPKHLVFASMQDTVMSPRDSSNINRKEDRMRELDSCAVYH